jgi:large subunit ribosomal protein L14
MIQVGAKLQIIDNSGGQIAQCVRVRKKKCAQIGDTILVAIQTALPKHRVKRGDLYPAVVVQAKKSIQRPDGSSIKNTENCIVLVNEKGNPLGTRVTSAFNYEIQKSSPELWRLAQYSH